MCLSLKSLVEENIMDVIAVPGTSKQIHIKNILKKVPFLDDDIVFLSGSIIEGIQNQSSQGMGNMYSDLDVFILRNDKNFDEKLEVVYDQVAVLKTFYNIDDVNIDVEVYKKSTIEKIIRSLNECSFDSNIRTPNQIKFYDGFNQRLFVTFMHRFINSLVIYNEKEYLEMKDSLAFDNFYRYYIRMCINRVDMNYEDVVGNLNKGEYEVAAIVAREILIETAKAFIGFNEETIDRLKWIPLKLRNLALLSEYNSNIYRRFVDFQFYIAISDQEDLPAYVEDILMFADDVIGYITNKKGI